jgi:hypothetical protein
VACQPTADEIIAAGKKWIVQRLYLVWPIMAAQEVFHLVSFKPHDHGHLIDAALD